MKTFWVSVVVWLFYYMSLAGTVLFGITFDVFNISLLQINACCSEDVIPEDLIHLFQSFMQQCLSLVTLIARGHGLYGNISKFWRASLARIYEILDKVCSCVCVSECVCVCVCREHE